MAVSIGQLSGFNPIILRFSVCNLKEVTPIELEPTATNIKLIVIGQS